MPLTSVSWILESNNVGSRPLSKWTKHGFTCIFIGPTCSAAAPPLYITIFMDVLPNPGPLMRDNRISSSARPVPRATSSPNLAGLAYLKLEVS